MPRATNLWSPPAIVAIHDIVSRECFRIIGFHPLTYLPDNSDDQNYLKDVFAVFPKNYMKWGM